MKSSNPRWALVALRHGFVWKGRARRAESWWCAAVFLFVPILLTLLQYMTAFFGSDESTVISWVVTIETLLFVIGLLPGLSCAIRRLHDLDRPGSWLLMIFPLTFIGGFILIYWFLQRGTIGENRYGPDPLMAD